MVKKFKNTVLWTYVIRDLKGEGTVGLFYEKELHTHKKNQTELEKVIKRIGDKAK